MDSTLENKEEQTCCEGYKEYLTYSDTSVSNPMGEDEIGDSVSLHPEEVVIDSYNKGILYVPLNYCPFCGTFLKPVHIKTKRDWYESAILSLTEKVTELNSKGNKTETDLSSIQSFEKTINEYQETLIEIRRELISALREKGNKKC